MSRGVESLQQVAKIVVKKTFENTAIGILVKGHKCCAVAWGDEVFRATIPEAEVKMLLSNHVF